MAIYRTKRANNFTTIPNALVMDKSLSAKAKGVLIYLLSRPNNWQVSGVEVAKNFSDGKTAIYAALEELEASGYVVKSEVRSKGKFSGVNYDVYDSPISGFPNSEKPIPENRELLNTDITNTELTKEYMSTEVDVPTKETFILLVRKLGFSDKVIATPKRLSLLRKRLKAFTVEELLAAADAVRANAWLQGQNPQSKRYGTIDYLLRSDEQINNLLLDSEPSKPMSHFEEALKRQYGHSS